MRSGGKGSAESQRLPASVSRAGDGGSATCKRELEACFGRLLAPRRDCPRGAGLVLRLHGAERANHVPGVAERWRHQVLILGSQSGDAVHS